MDGNKRRGLTSISLLILLAFTAAAAIAFFWFAYTFFYAAARETPTVVPPCLYYAGNKTLILYIYNPGPNLPTSTPSSSTASAAT